MADQERAWETWRWDETLFAGAAAYYRTGRLPYSPMLASALAGALGLDGRGRLLDVGCGPGVVTVELAPSFETVVGLDPDGDMLTEAARFADERAVGNVRWVQMRAEELPGELGTFRVATLAASFHWMNRPRVASILKSMLETGGAAVQVDASAYLTEYLAAAGRVGLPHPAPPDEAISGLRKRYLGPDRRAGKGIRNTSPGDEDAVFRAAGFQPAESVMAPDGRVLVRTVDDLVANVFSSSSTAPPLFGDRVEEFEADLRSLLVTASPSGLYSVRLPANRLSIWRS